VTSVAQIAIGSIDFFDRFTSRPVGVVKDARHALDCHRCHHCDGRRDFATNLRRADDVGRSDRRCGSEENDTLRKLDAPMVYGTQIAGRRSGVGRVIFSASGNY
jgi:hypothetical protein